MTDAECSEVLRDMRDALERRADNLVMVEALNRALEMLEWRWTIPEPDDDRWYTP